jgi:hypothetical protein
MPAMTLVWCGGVCQCGFGIAIAIAIGVRPTHPLNDPPPPSPEHLAALDPALPSPQSGLEPAI